MNERQYKDSGVGWIGNIPQNWNVMKLLFQLRSPITDGPHETPKLVEESCGIPFISVDSLNDTKKVDLSIVKKYISIEDYNEYKKKAFLEKGDVLFTKAATIGKTAIVDEPTKYMIWSPIAILKPKKGCFNEYLYYILNCKEAIQYTRDIIGHETTQVNVGMRDLEKLQVPIAPFDEQIDIVEYLDSKTASINSAIQAQKDIVEKLKEYKQAVITEAVTKGLDRDVEMKDSGIEWIGMVPSNWYTMRIKDVIVRSKDGIKIGPFGSALTGKTVSNGNYYVYSQYNLINDDFSDTKNKITDDTFNMLKAYEVLPNDICLSMMGTIGKCKTVPSNIKRGIMDSHLIKIRLNERMIDKYFEYVYDKDYSGLCYKQMQFDKTGSIMDGLNTTIIKNLYLPVPPLEEQQQIAEYLDSKTATIDKAIEQKNAIIEKLEEYKKSIIYNAVTGKIDCRKDVIPE